MKHLTLLSKAAMCVATLVLGFSMPAIAQLTGYTAELDTMFLEMEDGNVLSELEYYGVYDVYANFTHAEDVLGAVYSDVVALNTPPMGIDAPCGCNNPASTSIVVDASNNPAFFTAFPEYEYDSFWTIGMRTSDEDGQLPANIGMGAATDLCSGLNIENGSLYITGTTGDWPANAVAGDTENFDCTRYNRLIQLASMHTIYLGGDG